MFHTTIFKRDKKIQKSLLDRRDDYRIFLLNKPHHQWILKYPKILSAFEYVIDSLGHSELSKLTLHPNDIIILNASGLYTLAVTSNDKKDYFILFQELINLINNNSTPKAAAIIAHELGHILCGHGAIKSQELKGQMEADDFVCSIGLGNELQDLLLEHKETQGVRERVNHLTVRLNMSEL